MPRSTIQQERSSVFRRVKTEKKKKTPSSWRKLLNLKSHSSTQTAETVYQTSEAASTCTATESLWSGGPERKPEEPPCSTTDLTTTTSSSSNERGKHSLLDDDDEIDPRVVRHMTLCRTTTNNNAAPAARQHRPDPDAPHGKDLIMAK